MLRIVHEKYKAKNFDREGTAATPLGTGEYREGTAAYTRTLSREPPLPMVASSRRESACGGQLS